MARIEIIHSLPSSRDFVLRSWLIQLIILFNYIFFIFPRLFLSDALWIQSTPLEKFVIFTSRCQIFTAPIYLKYKEKYKEKESERDCKLSEQDLIIYANVKYLMALANSQVSLFYCHAESVHKKQQQQQLVQGNPHTASTQNIAKIL